MSRESSFRPSPWPWIVGASVALNLVLVIFVLARSDSDSAPAEEPAAQAAAEPAGEPAEASAEAVEALYAALQPPQAPTLPVAAQPVASAPVAAATPPAPVAAAAPAAVAVEPAPVAPAPPADLEADQWQVVRASLRMSVPVTLAEPAAPFGDGVSAAFTRLIMWDLNLRRDLQPNDEMVVAYRIEPDQNVTVGAATYASSQLGRTLTAFHFQATGDEYASRWQEDGTEVPFRLVNGPLHDYEYITALLHDRQGHAGVDFKTPVGTEVRSPWDGVVLRSNWNWTNNGNCLEVQYPDGMVAKFLHLSENLVAEGDCVSAGQVIALTGNTGHTTGPHLHYQLNRGDRELDPLEVHGTERRTLPAGDMATFQSEVALWQSRFDTATLAAR